MESKKIRDSINKLLSQRKRLLTYATALALATSSLTGCSEDLFSSIVNMEQNNGKQDNKGKEKSSKTFSYDEIANSYYLSIYNANKATYEPYFCKKEKYFTKEDHNHENPRYKLVDIDTKKEIVLGFGTGSPETVEDVIKHIDWASNGVDHHAHVYSCQHDKENECLYEKYLEHDNMSYNFLYHHLGSNYEFDYVHGNNMTNLYIYGQVKDFLNPEDIKSNYTEEEYGQLKTSITENYFNKDTTSKTSKTSK